MTDAEILNKIQAIFEQNFGLEPARVIPEARLFEELDLDSIDAVDLAIKLQLTESVVVSTDDSGARTVTHVDDSDEHWTAP